LFVSFLQAKVKLIFAVNIMPSIQLKKLILEEKKMARRGKKKKKYFKNLILTLNEFEL
jgi:hypothetical protein